jgi:hypothetical protein
MIERVVLVCGILALLVLGAAQASTPEELLDELGKSPGINVTQVNETAVLQQAGNLSAPCCGSLNTDSCGRTSGETCNCPNRSGTCYLCQSCYSASTCCGGKHHVCCYEGRKSKHDPINDCDYVVCDP